MKRFTAVCRAAATLCLLAGAVDAQENVALTADQMRGYAAQLLRDGEAARAMAVARALLERNPADVDALFLQAQAAEELGDADLAISAYAAAYRATDDDGIRYVAARLVARNHADLSQYTRAQIWLRRARQYAPTAEAGADVADDYRFLRQRNPWSTQLRFGVTPTNNVNNGSSADSFFIFTPFAYGQALLNNEARALSGLAINAGFSTQYRLTQSRTSITHAEVAASGVTYALSSEAKAGLAADRDAANQRRRETCANNAANNILRGEDDIADGEALVAEGQAETPPNTDKIAEGEALIAQGEALIALGEDPPPCEQDDSPLSTGSDYAYANLSFGLSHKQILFDGARPTDFDLRVARSWYAGEPYSANVTASLAQSWDWGESSQINASVFAERRIYDSDRPSVTRAGVSGQIRTRRANGDRLTFRSGLQKSMTDDPLAATASNYRSASLGVDYDLAQPLAGMSFGFSADLERDYDYPFEQLYLTRRVDDAVTLRVDAQLNDLEYFGFRPVISIEGRAVESNVDRFDQRNYSLGFDLRSSF